MNDMYMKIPRLIQPVIRMTRSVKSWAELNAVFARTTSALGLRKNTSAAQFREYRSWIFTAINAINNRFKTIEFTIKRDDSGREISSDDPAYEAIWRPFKRPNAFQSFRQFKSFMQLQYDITGRSFALIIRNKLGQPAGLWNLRSSDFVRLHRGDTTTSFLLAFEFRGGKVYPENDVVYFYHPSPMDPLLSMSPIMALVLETDINYFSALYERDMFKKGAVPDIILSTDKRLDPTRIEAIQDRWQEKYGGEKNFHGVAIVDGGLKPTTISVSHRDLEVIALAKWNQDTILSAYQVPAGKVGLVRDVNKANALGIDITFNSECIWPRLMDFDEAFTRGVLWEFDRRLYMEHANPIPRDKEFELEEAFRKVTAGLWSRNESRRFMDGLDGIGPGGDSIYINMAEVEIGRAPAFKPDTDLKPAGPPIDDDIVEPEIIPVLPHEFIGMDGGGLSLLSDEVRALMIPDSETDAGRTLISKQFSRTIESAQEIWYPMLNRFFKSQRSGVLARLKAAFPRLQKIQSEKLTARMGVMALWEGILTRAGTDTQRLPLFVKADLNVLASTNGAVDMKLRKQFEICVNKRQDTHETLELLEAYYDAKTTDVIVEIVFNLEREAAKMKLESEPIIANLVKRGGQEAAAEAYADYISQNVGD